MRGFVIISVEHYFQTPLDGFFLSMRSKERNIMHDLKYVSLYDQAFGMV